MQSRYLNDLQTLLDCRSEIQTELKNHEKELAPHYWEMGKRLNLNYDEKRYWFTKAAEQGYWDEKCDLNCNESRALNYLSCAVNGDDYYFFRVGECYANGHGVPHDAEKAIYWMTKAAEYERDQGICSLAFYLGQRFAQGYGIPRDKEKADYWFEQFRICCKRQSHLNFGSFGCSWNVMLH